MSGQPAHQPQVAAYSPPIGVASGVDPQLPYGARGARPVWIGTTGEHTRAALQIPGIVASPQGGVLASWDAVAGLYVRYRWNLPITAPTFTGTLPGIQRYLQLGLDKKARAYQPAMTSFLVQRAMAINADPMRVGKTFETLAAVEACGFKKVLVVPPAIAKPGWAEQVATFLDEECLILSGRSGLDARWFCKACMGAGWRGESWCSACRARNGSSYGSRLVHGDVELDAGTLDLDDAVLSAAQIRAQQKAVADAIEKARVVICNYDILITQQAKTAAGARYEVDTLRGWSALLSSFAWDVIIPDEAHALRGKPKLRDSGKSRRDRLVSIARATKRVWALTGTPIYGRVSDGWGLLDVVTDGLFGRPHLSFEAAYADGKLVVDHERGIPKHWEAKGMTNVAELSTRIGAYMLRRERAEIVPFMPAKTRQVVRLEVRGKDKPPPRHMDAKAGIHEALRRTAGFKLPYVVSNVVDELSEGGKVVVCTYHVESAKEMFDAISKACRTGEMQARAKAVNVQGWLIHGSVAAEKRKPIADAFVRHAGAGFVVCSMGSVPGAISFKGASTVHFADLHHDPATLLQVEDRAYEIGTTGLSIIYYVVAQTVDEHVVGVVVPKMEQLERAVGDSAARDFATVFGAKQTDASADEIFARMCRAAEDAES